MGRIETLLMVLEDIENSDTMSLSELQDAVKLLATHLKEAMEYVRVELTPIPEHDIEQ